MDDDLSQTLINKSSTKLVQCMSKGRDPGIDEIVRQPTMEELWLVAGACGDRHTLSDL